MCKKKIKNCKGVIIIIADAVDHKRKANPIASVARLNILASG